MPFESSNQGSFLHSLYWAKYTPRFVPGAQQAIDYGFGRVRVQDPRPIELPVQAPSTRGNMQLRRILSDSGGGGGGGDGQDPPVGGGPGGSGGGGSPGVPGVPGPSPIPPFIPPPPIIPDPPPGDDGIIPDPPAPPDDPPPGDGGWTGGGPPTCNSDGASGCYDDKLALGTLWPMTCGTWVIYDADIGDGLGGYIPPWDTFGSPPALAVACPHVTGIGVELCSCWAQPCGGAFVPGRCTAGQTYLVALVCCYADGTDRTVSGGGVCVCP